MVATEVAMREKTFNVRFNEEEWARLDTISGFHGVTAAGLIRMLLKQEERRIAAESSGSDLRWHHVKNQAARNFRDAAVPNLTMRVDEDTRTVVFTDGRWTKAVAGGQDVWFTLAMWPGSKLSERDTGRAFVFDDHSRQMQRDAFPGDGDNAKRHDANERQVQALIDSARKKPTKGAAPKPTRKATKK